MVSFARNLRNLTHIYNLFPCLLAHCCKTLDADAPVAGQVSNTTLHVMLADGRCAAAM